MGQIGFFNRQIIQENKLLFLWSAHDRRTIEVQRLRGSRRIHHLEGRIDHPEKKKFSIRVLRNGGISENVDGKCSVVKSKK
jgi:hypothetical protein